MERLAKRKYRNDKRKRWMEVTLEKDEAGFWVCSSEWTDGALVEADAFGEAPKDSTNERRFDEESSAWDFIGEMEGLADWKMVASQGKHGGVKVMPVHHWPTREEAVELAKRLDDGFWYSERSTGSKVFLVVDDGENGGLTSITRAHHKSVAFAFARQACINVLEKSGFGKPQSRSNLQEPKKLMKMLREIGLSPGKLFMELWQNADSMREAAQ